jgi:polar amino acid transport system substrate-binding protein
VHCARPQRAGSVVRRSLLLAACALALPAAGQPVLVLNDAGAAPYTNEARTGFVDVIAAEAFHRAGLALELVRLPAERALRLADAGRIDGELMRVGGLEAQYAHLRRVPEPIAEVGFAAFSRDRRMAANFKALKSHSVGLIRGWKIYERAMAGGARIATASDPEQLFRLLALGRIDVALYERSMGVALAMSLALDDVHRLEPVLAVRDVYTYLHRRHAAAVPRLADALRAMRREGFTARARRKILRPYLEPAR